MLAPARPAEGAGGAGTPSPPPFPEDSLALALPSRRRGRTGRTLFPGTVAEGPVLASVVLTPSPLPRVRGNPGPGPLVRQRGKESGGNGWSSRQAGRSDSDRCSQHLREWPPRGRAMGDSAGLHCCHYVRGWGSCSGTGDTPHTPAEKVGWPSPAVTLHEHLLLQAAKVF